MKLKIPAKLDAGFEPMSVVCREMREGAVDGQDIVVAVERNKGYTKVYKTRIYKDNTGHDEINCKFIDRIAKTLLWLLADLSLLSQEVRLSANISRMLSHTVALEISTCALWREFTKSPLR